MGPYHSQRFPEALNLIELKTHLELNNTSVVTKLPIESTTELGDPYNAVREQR